MKVLLSYIAEIFLDVMFFFVEKWHTAFPRRLSEEEILSYLESRNEAMLRGPVSYRVWQELEYLTDAELEQIRDYEKRYGRL